MEKQELIEAMKRNLAEKKANKDIQELLLVLADRLCVTFEELRCVTHQAELVLMESEKGSRHLSNMLTDLTQLDEREKRAEATMFKGIQLAAEMMQSTKKEDLGIKEATQKYEGIFEKIITEFNAEYRKFCEVKALLERNKVAKEKLQAKGSDLIELVKGSGQVFKFKDKKMYVVTDTVEVCVNDYVLNKKEKRQLADLIKNLLKPCMECRAVKKDIVVMRCHCMLCKNCLRTKLLKENNALLKGTFEAKEKQEAMCVCPEHNWRIEPYLLQGVFSPEEVELYVVEAMKREMKEAGLRNNLWPNLCIQCKKILNVKGRVYVNSCYRHKVCNDCLAKKNAKTYINSCAFCAKNKRLQ